MLTRDAFDQQREAVNQVNRREGRRLALLSVLLGVGQLVFLRWTEQVLPGPLHRAVAAGLFVGYMAMVGVLLWRLRRHLRLAAPACPQCHAPLQGTSARIAAATGHCDRCGAQVIGVRPE